MRQSTNLGSWRQLHPSVADLNDKTKTTKKSNPRRNEITMKESREISVRTENCGFPGIVEAENKNSSFFVTEKRRKQPGKHQTHVAQIRIRFNGFFVEIEVRSQGRTLLLPAKSSLYVVQEDEEARERGLQRIFETEQKWNEQDDD